MFPSEDRYSFILNQLGNSHSVCQALLYPLVPPVKNQQKFDGGKSDFFKESICSQSKACSLFTVPFVISYRFGIVCEVENLLFMKWLFTCINKHIKSDDDSFVNASLFLREMKEKRGNYWQCAKEVDSSLIPFLTLMCVNNLGWVLVTSNGNVKLQLTIWGRKSCM